MELLVVIAIIGILAVVAVPSLIKNIDKTKISEVKSDISAIKTSIKMFYLDNGRWPCTRHEQSDYEEVFKNIDNGSRKSPFNGDYAVYCIHKSKDGSQTEDETQPIVRMDIGGFTVNNTVKEMMENDDSFKSLNISYGKDENKDIYTVWMSMDVKE